MHYDILVSQTLLIIHSTDFYALSFDPQNISFIHADVKSQLNSTYRNQATLQNLFLT